MYILDRRRAFVFLRYIKPCAIGPRDTARRPREENQ